jgi:hypothetical protein
MRRLLLIAVGAVLFAGAGCMLPPTDDAEERRFWGPDLPREILGMEAKPTQPAPAAPQPVTPDRAPNVVR